MDNINWRLTRRNNSIWIAAVIAVVVGAMGAIPLRNAETQRLEAIRADIRLIDAAATQLASR
jgi:uncharacterized membrane protein YdcZ (DUF606 family)